MHRRTSQKESLRGKGKICLPFAFWLLCVHKNGKIKNKVCVFFFLCCVIGKEKCNRFCFSNQVIRLFFLLVLLASAFLCSVSSCFLFFMVSVNVLSLFLFVIVLFSCFLVGNLLMFLVYLLSGKALAGGILPLHCTVVGLL